MAGEEPHPQDPDPEEADEEGEAAAPTPGGAEEEEGPRYHQKARSDHRGVEDRRRGPGDYALGGHGGAEVAYGVIPGAVAGVERLGGDDPQEGDDPRDEEEGSG